MFQQSHQVQAINLWRQVLDYQAEKNLTLAKSKLQEGMKSYKTIKEWSALAGVNPETMSKIATVLLGKAPIVSPGN